MGDGVDHERRSEDVVARRVNSLPAGGACPRINADPAVWLRVESRDPGDEIRIWQIAERQNYGVCLHRVLGTGDRIRTAST
jgi:hypothetical protein